jgi:CHAD domain-containing protein
VPQKPLQLEADEGFQLSGLAGRDLPTRVYTETYFDTADGRLGRAGFALRRRVENGKGTWQLTVSSDGASLDVEAAGGPSAPPAELRDLVSAASGGFSLGPVARLRARVGGIRVRQGRHSLARVSVSSIAVLDGRRVVRELNEIDVEPLAADRKQLAQIEKALRKAGARRGGRQPRLARAVDAEAPSEAPAPTRELDLLRSFFREQYARLLAHDPGVRLGTSPEDLHQLRVASRRLRSVLKTSTPVLDEAWVERLREELSWLGGELGPARDLDVLLDHLRGEIAQLEPADRKALKPLVAKLEWEREAIQARVLDALRSERYFGLLASIEGAAAAPPAGSNGTSLEDAAQAEIDRLRKAMTKLEKSPSDETLHRARIKGKRARYAAELFEPEHGKAMSRLIQQAKRFQDVAGEHQDAVVAERRIRELVTGSRSAGVALAAGMLVARQRERRRRAAEALPRAWTRLDQAAAKAWA